MFTPVAKALVQHGFFALRGHGVPPAVTLDAFDAGRRFFALPEPTKRRWYIDARQRGFDPIGWQALDPAQPPDLKESFYLGVEAIAPNQWPDESLVPGFRAACDTYALLGEGADPKKLPPETSAEHSACVHKHLSLRGGAGPSYGDGILRAGEGASALWKEAERDLRLGVSQMGGPAKDAVEAHLKTIEGATLKLALKKVENPTTPTQVVNTLLEVHEDAGIHIAPRDGGAPEAGGPPLKKRL